MQGKLKDSNMRSSIVLPRELRARVDEHCAQTGAPFTEFARRALNAYLETVQQKQKEPA